MARIGRTPALRPNGVEDQKAYRSGRDGLSWVSKNLRVSLQMRENEAPGVPAGAFSSVTKLQTLFPASVQRWMPFSLSSDR